MFESLIQAWDGEEVVIHYERELQTWMFVAVHSTRLGPGCGGTRLKIYPSPADGLRDVLRLSTAMTRKLAVASVPYGGGKAVLAVPRMLPAEDRIRLMERYGDLVDSLGGTYRTAPDVNTSDADMDIIATRTRWVFGKSPAAGGAGSTAPATATGVYHAIRASVGHVFGSEDLAGRRILVQGAGGVGAPLCALLAGDGATVLVSDVDERRAEFIAAQVGAAVIPAAGALTGECDVFAPCALGGVLNPDTIPGLRCRIVAGAANNQLREDSDAELLRARGILYAPDYVANAGGVLHGLGLEEMGWTQEHLDARLRGIADTLLEVFRMAEAQGTTTEAAAEWIAQRNIAAGSDVAV